MFLTNLIVGLLECARKTEVEISEITVSETQMKQLAAECGVELPANPHATVNVFCGVKLVVRPNPAPRQKAAKQLRELAKQESSTPEVANVLCELADQLEKEDKQ